MTLPASGTITLQQIAAEFGAALPIGLTALYRGGGLVPNIPQNSGVPTSGAISATNFYGATNIAVNLTNHSITGSTWQETNPTPPPAQFNRLAQSRIQVQSGGQLVGGGSIGGVYPSGSSPNFTTVNYSGEWLVAGGASNFDCMLTVISGVVFGSATAAWLNCATTRIWTSGVAGTVCTLQLRPAGGGATLDNCTINLN